VHDAYSDAIPGVSMCSTRSEHTYFNLNLATFRFNFSTSVAVELKRLASVLKLFSVMSQFM